MPGVHNGIKVDGKKPPRLISGVEAYRIITRIYLRGRYAPAFISKIILSVSQEMAAKITPHLIHLTYEGALKSFWRKTALRKFLRECHIAESFLATWASDESKREFLDRAFEKLQKTDKGKAVIYQMAVFLADQTTFPDLRNWEDSDQKISEAAKAVGELKQYLRKQDNDIKDEREKDAVKKAARERQQKVQRAQIDKQKLEISLNSLQPSIGTQQGGYDFQDWFYNLLDFSEITNRRPYVSEGRQIDGSLTHEGTTYLVELKFTGDQSAVTDIDSLKNKVEDKADNTMGIMVSISGYSSVATSQASGRKTPLMLMDASHLYLFLTGGMNFKDIISRIRRHVSQTGEAYLPVNKFGG
jgi:hypothetical protein